MQKLSTGEDATLGNYLRLAEALGMEGGARYLREKIAASPHGADEEVLVDERQMILLLRSIADTVPAAPAARATADLICSGRDIAFAIDLLGRLMEHAGLPRPVAIVLPDQNAVRALEVVCRTGLDMFFADIAPATGSKMMVYGVEIRADAARNSAAIITLPDHWGPETAAQFQDLWNSAGITPPLNLTPPD